MPRLCAALLLALCGPAHAQQPFAGIITEGVKAGITISSSSELFMLGGMLTQKLYYSDGQCLQPVLWQAADRMRMDMLMSALCFYEPPMLRGCRLFNFRPRTIQLTDEEESEPGQRINLITTEQ